MKLPPLSKCSLWIGFGWVWLSLVCIQTCPIQSQDSGEKRSPQPSAVCADAIDQYIAQARLDWGVPGLAVAVVKDDQVVLMKGYGVKQVDQPDEADAQTLFAIASNTKAFTAAGLSLLVDEGKLRWNDPVQRYLPWLELYDPYVTSELRIHDLLCHRSGLGTFSGDLLWYGTGYDAKDILSRARHLQPDGPFRAHFGYSNLMYLAAGEVLEAVSGQTWTEFMHQRFFDPLTMHRTITSIRELERLGNVATPHKTWLDRSEKLDWENWDSMMAAGGIISSVEDMAKWMRMLLNRGETNDGKRILPAGAFADLWESHMPIRVSPSFQQRFPSTHFRAYGLGWMLADYQGHKIVSHGGGYDGMYSQVILVPELKLGVVVLTNSMTSIADTLASWIVDRYLNAPDIDRSQQSLEQFRQSRERFRARIDQAVSAVPNAPRPSHPLIDYAGTYRCPMYGDVSVTLENDQLKMELLPNARLVADLEPLHYDTFVIRWRNRFAWFEEGTAHFIAGANGQIVELKLDVPNDDLWFHELKLVRIRTDH